MATASRVYEFLPELRLRVAGARSVLRHFDAEYAPAIGSSAGGIGVDVAFAGEADGDAVVVRGGHKTVRWDVRLADPAAESLRAAIALRGRPVAFGLSLVQGYFVEPLLSLAAASRGYVLLPSAALAADGAAVLVIGRSRSGKSSVTVRALAAGKTVLGDDQVFVDSSAGAWPFPRRLRFYSDIADTAPAAYRKLRPSTRAQLAALALVRRLTRGFVAPPVRVPPSDLGRTPESGRRPLRRIVLVERGGKGEALDVTELGADAALGQALAILDEQRSKLSAADRPAWRAALARAREQEEEILREGFRAVRVERVAVPTAWSAPVAIAALSDYVGAER